MQVASASHRWPQDDVWLRCGNGAAHFDEIVVKDLGVRMLNNLGCTFFRGSTTPSVLYTAATGDMGNTPEVYGCDSDGDCILLDVPGERTLELRRADWNGSAWVNDQVITQYKICTGVACSYNRAFSASDGRLSGEIDDGTQVFLANVTGGDEQDELRLYLISP